MTPTEMHKAAVEVLGTERVTELAQFPSLSNNTATTLSPSQDTQDSTSQGSALNNPEVPDVEQGIESR